MFLNNNVQLFRESSLKIQTFFVVDKIVQKLGLLLILEDSVWKGSWKVLTWRCQLYSEKLQEAYW